jgi:hypothetical protein
MTILTPTEYLYLSSPYWSDGTGMVKTTFQELCLKNVLCIESRMLVVDKRDGRKRKRNFLKLGEIYLPASSFSLAEKRLLSLFEIKNEWSFSEIRSYVLKHFNDSSDEFKKQYVLPDLKKKKLVTFSFLLSSKARREKNDLEKKLKLIDNNIDSLIQDRTLGDHLKEIGPNIILLEKATIEKIKESANVLRSGELDFLLHTNNFNTLDAISMIGSFSAIHSFDFSGADVDFGGGDFGGAGGGGGDW